VIADETESTTRQLEVSQLLTQLRATDDPEEARLLRDRLTELQLPLVAYLARRFAK